MTTVGRLTTLAVLVLTEQAEGNARRTKDVLTLAQLSVKKQPGTPPQPLRHFSERRLGGS